MSSIDVGAATALYGTGQGAGTAPEAVGAELGQDQFLTLLVTQLQSQDPLNPQDPQEFVAQLAQFSQVEQLMAANARLDGVMQGMLALNNLAALDLVGTEVVAVSDQITLGGEGGGDLAFHSGGAGTATVVVTDSAGDVVYTRTVDAQEGLNELPWDGRDSEGDLLPAGEYGVSVTVTGADGEAVEAQPCRVGTVEGVSFESGTAELLVGGVAVTLSDIVSVRPADGGEPEGAAGEDAQDGGGPGEEEAVAGADPAAAGEAKVKGGIDAPARQETGGIAARAAYAYQEFVDLGALLGGRM